MTLFVKTCPICDGVGFVELPGPPYGVDAECPTCAGVGFAATPWHVTDRLRPDDQPPGPS